MAHFAKRAEAHGAQPNAKQKGTSSWRGLSALEARSMAAPSFGASKGGAARCHCFALEGKCAELGAVLAQGDDPDGAGLLFSFSPPLHLAAARGHVDACETLLDRGARVDLADHVRRGGRFAAHLAVIFDHCQVLSVLLDCGCDPNCVDAHGASLLSTAAAAGHFDCVGLLLNQPKIRTRQRVDYSNELPIHLAVRQGHARVVELILDHEAGHCAVSELDVDSMDPVIAKGDAYSKVSNLARAYGNAASAAAMDACVLEAKHRLFPKPPVRYDGNGDKIPPKLFCATCDKTKRDLTGAKANRTHSTAQHAVWQVQLDEALKRKARDDVLQRRQRRAEQPVWRLQ